MSASSIVPDGSVCSIQFPLGVIILVYLFCLFGNDEFYVWVCKYVSEMSVFKFS